jgi:hypothetical protein
MAYIDDLTAPRARKRPVIGGVQTPDPIAVGYQGPSPADVNGNPNDAYDGNTGIRPPKIPPVPTPPPITPPPMGPDNGGGGGAQTAQPRTAPRPAPPATPAPQTINFQQALNDLYRKYFYRAPHADELQAHITGLTQGYGTLQGIEAELAREQQRLGLKPPTSAPTAPASGAGQYVNPNWNPDKLARASSPLYKVRQAISRFDPRQGITPEVLAVLNGLGLGTFEALSKDKVRIANPDAGWEGYTEWDLIDAFNSGNGTWSGNPFGGPGYAAEQAAAQAAQAAAANTGAAPQAGTTAQPGAAAGGGSSALPPGGAPGLGAIGGQLGGSQGVDFGITGPYGYDDPSTQQLEEFLRLLIDDKTNPIDDPAREDYARVLKQRFESLIAPGAGVNAGASDLDRQLQDAITALTGNPALSGNDLSRLENRALEPMERDRQAAIQRETERLAAMGHGRESGTYVEAIDRINRQFDQRRGEVQRDLSIYDREQQDERRQEAVTFGTQRRDVIEREQDRERGRYGDALTMAEALSNLSGQQRSEQDARMREALTYVSLFPEMDERRLRLAMETLGLSSGMSNPSSIFSTLSNLSAQANAAAAQGRQENAAFWNQMGQWMATSWGAGS